jgi:hypothetical protein
MSSSMNRFPTRWAVSAVMVSAFCGAAWATPPDTGQAAAGQVATDGSQPAVWTQKELTFVYQGFTTKYSCDGLRDKMRGVLLQLGAKKKDLKVNEYGCTSSFGRPDPFPGVQIKMSVLQPAAADSKQPPVGAHWTPVDLKLPDSTFSNDSGECELVEEIRAKILPSFTTRDVNLRDNCIPFQQTATRPTLKLEVLAPDKPAGQSDKAAGAAAH